MKRFVSPRMNMKMNKTVWNLSRAEFCPAFLGSHPCFATPATAHNLPVRSSSFTPVPTDQRLNRKAFVHISVSHKSPDLWCYPLKMYSPGADPGVFAAPWICILQHLKSFTNCIPPSKIICLSKLSCEVAFHKQKSI